MVRIVAIAGSLRPLSRTRRALELALEGARTAGSEVEVLDLGSPRLPLFDGEKELPGLPEFRAKIASADGLLIATPVYHDSYSGVLKNAVDHLYDELNEKLVALIAVGGGRNGQGQALEHLRAVFRETNSWVLPRQVIVPSAETTLQEGVEPDPEILQRLSWIGRELVMRAKLMKVRKVPAAAR